MPRTYADVELKFIDVTALSDAQEATENNQSIGNIGLLKKETKTSLYATLELNQFILDGSRQEMPYTPTDIVFWSNTQSKTDRKFTVNPTITVTFTENHTSAGITLYFDDIYPSEVKITWYQLDGTKIISKTFQPDSLTYFCRNQVTNYGKVVIEITKTAFPYRYAKLDYILYGLYLHWSDDTVSKGTLVEQIDETSNTLSINTLDIDIIDEANDFDIANPNGAWNSAQRNQQVTAKEYKDGVFIPIGKFYLDTWSFKSNIASFSFIDPIGYISRFKFSEGEVYNNATFSYIVGKIMAAAGFTDYTIAEDLKNLTLSGYLEIMSCKDALQMACFAVGAVADCSRGSTIKIYVPDRYISHYILPNRKFNGKTSVTMDEYTSGITVNSSKCTIAEKTSNIYDDYLPVGDTRIEFSDPYKPDTITATGGTVKMAKTNYCIITMTAAGNCTVEGKAYEKTDFSLTKSVEKLDAGEVESIRDFTCPLYNMEILQDNINRLLQYYRLRKIVDLEFLIDTEMVGQWSAIMDVEGRLSATLMEQNSIDLSGGFISTMKCRGYATVVTDYYFCGTELYAGDGGII